MSNTIQNFISSMQEGIDKSRSVIQKISQQNYDERKYDFDKSFNEYSFVYGTLITISEVFDIDSNYMTKIKSTRSRLAKVSEMNFDKRVPYTDESCAAFMEVYGILKGILFIEMLKLKSTSSERPLEIQSN